MSKNRNVAFEYKGKWYDGFGLVQAMTREGEGDVFKGEAALAHQTVLSTFGIRAATDSELISFPRTLIGGDGETYVGVPPPAQTLRSNLRNVPMHVAAREPFTANKLVGRYVHRDDHFKTVGLKADQEAEWIKVMSGVARGDLVYAVFSYDTVIGWWVSGQDKPVLIKGKFSLATTRHQAVVRDGFAEALAS